MLSRLITLVWVWTICILHYASDAKICTVDTATSMASPTVVQSWTRVPLAVWMRDKWQFLRGGWGFTAPSLLRHQEYKRTHWRRYCSNGCRYLSSLNLQVVRGGFICSGGGRSHSHKTGVSDLRLSRGEKLHCGRLDCDSMLDCTMLPTY
jgi:hypothetical protein